MANPLNHNLADALKKIDRPATFCVSGSADPVLPGLEINNVGPIGFPLTASQAKEIREHCEQAPYGKGEDTVVDTSVRRVWQLMPDQFQLTNPAWQKFMSEVLAKVKEELGLHQQKLESHLYNLLLYEPGSFFLPHKDGEKLDRMVATLVIALPSTYEGGELIVRHDGQTQTVTFGKSGSTRFMMHYAAFYADCEHEIKPVRKGYRLCLVYNLTVGKSKKAIAAPRAGEHVEKIANLLRDWPTQDAPHKVAITLDHEYTENGLAWDALKGADRFKAEVLQEAARQAKCKCFLALLTFHESGSAEYSGGSHSRRGRYYDDDYDSDDASDYEIGEIFDSELGVDKWIDPDGKRVNLREMGVDESEVVPEESLRDVEPEEDFEGYTGNAGMTIDRWYRHAVIMLWREDRHFAVLCDCGLWNAFAGFEDFMAKYQKASKRTAETLKAQCIDFADKILAAWAPQQIYRMQEPDKHKLTFLKSMAVLDDPNLIKTFLGKVLPMDMSVDLPPAIVKVCSKHGWANFAKELIAVFQNTTLESLQRNVRVLEQVCLAKSKEHEWIELYQTATQETYAALEKLDRPAATHDWRLEQIKRAEVLAGLAKSMIATDQREPLSQLVAHAMATPNRYPLTPVHVEALLTLEPWLSKHVSKAPPVLTKWIGKVCDHLESLTAVLPTEPNDFRRDGDVSCNCAHCAELNTFLKNPREKSHAFRAAQHYRTHLEEMIRKHQCDVDCETIRRASPYTLACTKNTKSLGRKLKVYHRNNEQLAKLRTLKARLPKDAKALRRL